MPYKPSAELDELIRELLGPEKVHFFECVDQELPHTIRFNALKGNDPDLKSFFEEQGFTCENFPNFRDIYRLIYQPYPIGKSLSHFLGHFYIQDIASMLPPRILEPVPGDTVLDMSAAPGSKTTQMAIMMKNSGFILANDIVQKRLRALINNLIRLGIVNTAVVKNYGESFGNQYFETFDKILLDPACSGLGTLHKNPEVLSWWTLNHVTRLASSQRSLIASAIKSLKPGGLLVYSTCTLTPQENEEVVDFALREFPVELVPFEIPELVSRPGLTQFKAQNYLPELELTRRLYPFENQTEGFFLAKMRKTERMSRTSYKKERKPYVMNFIPDLKSPVKKYLDYFAEHFDIDRKVFSSFRYSIDKEISVVSPELADFIFRTRPLKCGLTAGRTMTQIGKLTTEGVHLFGKFSARNRIDLNSVKELEEFVNRNPLSISDDLRGQIIVSYKNLLIGYGLTDGGNLKSQFPKAEWPFKLGN
ncbi:MAG: NOL1/NOP2/sun family putative RNA methylase [Calditrichaeota bacterium]|nr:NOL1/NOP2/sun family putative RNA methylase [Calditrichota bacterium]RQW07566.1 MAG: NOL1/NOP2/sun family putative RNA methylase [Calditrichota bacterium]